ncbi:uncharacterized protein KGF55_005770 [Candida pseudojiufengensis]|uniref:uncharacterized protein n=1 Tax=Candida pseudojiufengensis TaxID=497109 RepID=UPI0022251C54|nr:uncharacterized protein KGF55_005770 [Candida pseudojiufengensis]KAI5958510.1 hypothetical protein KGF55_005770 [Candida pseudojiufengensis]
MDTPNVDIFQNLDMPLLEVFQRGQINQYLDTLSTNDRLETIEAIHRVMRNHNNQRRPRSDSNITYINNYIRIRWFKFLPIILLNYSRIWSNLTIQNLKHYLKLSILKVFYIMVQSIRTLFFLIMIQSYFHGIMNMIFAFCDVLTFSDNFLKDLITFIVNDNLNFLQKHEKLMENNGDLFYFMDIESNKNLSILQNLKFFIINYIVSMLSTNCIKESESDNKIKCIPIKSTLIFKIFDSISNSFPQITNKLTLKYLTIFIYLTYAMIGNVICINILMFFIYNFMNKILSYNQFLKNMKDVVKNTFIQYLA